MYFIRAVDAEYKCGNLRTHTDSLKPGITCRIHTSYFAYIIIVIIIIIIIRILLPLLRKIRKHLAEICIPVSKLFLFPRKFLVLVAPTSRAVFTNHGALEHYGSAEHLQGFGEK
jgi:hypothetical protein